MSVPWAGGSDVPGNASGRALSEAGRRYDMATRYMFPNGLRLRGRDLAVNGFSWTRSRQWGWFLLLRGGVSMGISSQEVTRSGGGLTVGAGL